MVLLISLVAHLYAKVLSLLASLRCCLVHSGGEQLQFLLHTSRTIIPRRGKGGFVQYSATRPVRHRGCHGLQTAALVPESSSCISLGSPAAIVLVHSCLADRITLSQCSRSDDPEWQLEP